MENKLEIFSNSELGSVRIIMIEDEPHFVAKDVCEILGIKDHTTSIRSLREKKEGVVLMHPLQTNGGTQNINILTEQGLYLLITQSRKPIAVEFQLWVTGEVLPTIRKLKSELEKIVTSPTNKGFVYYKDNTPKTNSLILSNAFDKQHKNVLRAIKNTIDNLQNIEGGKEFNQLNFEPVSYLDDKGEQRTMYEMTEQGFSYVALGFTGKKADKFKLKFINEFFRMRENLIKTMKAELVRNVLPQTNRDRQFVYVFKNPLTNYVKIGITNNIDKRQAQLETGAGVKLELIYNSVITTNARDIERLAHEYFKDYNIFGEWFDVDSNVVIDFLQKQEYVLRTDFSEIDVIDKIINKQIKGE
jgi:Rha family phage regulatory protein